jgi:hypothetical protein
VAKVEFISQPVPVQSKFKQANVMLTIDGGIAMETKKLGVNFKKLAIGLSFGTMMNMSVLP